MRAPYDPASGGSPDTVSSGAQRTRPQCEEARYPDDSGGADDTGEISGTLLDLIGIAGFVLDPDGRVAVWAPTAVELTGRPVEEMLGSRVEELFPVAVRDQAAEQFRGVPGGTGRVGYLPVLHADGRVFDVGFRAVAMRFPDGRDLVQVIAADASRLRRVELERAQFETLFGQVPAGIAIYDAERRYVRVNPAYTQYDGVPVEQHPGLRSEETVKGLDPEIPLLQQQVLDTGEPVFDLLIEHDPKASKRPGRGPFWSVSYARLESPDGEVLGLTGVVVDVTDRQLAQERSRLARRRAALLGAANNRVGTSLDYSHTSAQLAEVSVPMFADSAIVYLLDDVTSPLGTVNPPDPQQPLHLHAVAERGRAHRRRGDPVAVERMGAELPPVEPGTELHDCLMGGHAQFIRDRDGGNPDLRDDRCLVAPLVARGVLVGAVRFTRTNDRVPFLRDDLETADELAGRAAVSIDNARLYVRERSAALMLQRWLLPEQVPDVDNVRLAHRYRPGSIGAEVGGDWFDVIALPGRRVALVVGDVMGSGLRVAGIMGQFRTAARTLARLDLSPAAVLRELDELARSLSESHIATCVYVVYDAVAGKCVAATAGHLPPIIAEPGGVADVLDLAPGAPLGVGRAKFDEREFAVEPGAVLVLYTDGLVEDRDRDIDDGIDDLLGVISKADPASDPARLEAVCDAAFETLLTPQRADDATLLVAALDRFADERVASWVLTSQPTVAAHARELVRRQLGRWTRNRLAGADNLKDAAADTIELLVSELVTNALRYGRGPIGLRLLLSNGSLTCEVADELDAAPRLRTVHHGDEGGRGLHLVDQLSTRWGIRATAHGKVVWFEVDIHPRHLAP
jgi:PAS domain S-box-containing protein